MASSVVSADCRRGGVGRPGRRCGRGVGVALRTAGRRRSHHTHGAASQPGQARGRAAARRGAARAAHRRRAPELNGACQHGQELALGHQGGHAGQQAGQLLEKGVLSHTGVSGVATAESRPSHDGSGGVAQVNPCAAQAKPSTGPRAQGPPRQHHHPLPRQCTPPTFSSASLMASCSRKEVASARRLRSTPASSRAFGLSRRAGWLASRRW